MNTEEKNLKALIRFRKAIKDWNNDKKRGKDLMKFRKAIKDWNYDNENIITHFPSDSKATINSMKNMLKRDRKELTKILRLIIKNEYKEAGEKAIDLDTVVREQIPARLYNKIDKARCDE